MNQEGEETNHLHVEEAYPLQSRTESTPSLIASWRCPLKRSFLQSVKNNNVQDVRVLASENKLDDPQACDELGRTALIVAIDKGNQDMIKCLVELQPNIDDGLFHAVSIRSAPAVRTICKNLPEAIQRMRQFQFQTKLDTINGYPIGHCYPAVMTPLLLAGKNNDFDIIKILLHHGAKMPRLEDLVGQASDDSYVKFLAMVHWYEAGSSEAYILLTSNDPLDTIFRLGESLEEVEESLHGSLFNVERERIQEKLADLSIKLLSLARDNKEIGLLLRGGEKASLKPKVPLRIQQALKIDNFKKFVSHPSSQAYMCAEWEIPQYYFLARYPRFVQSNLFNIMVIFLYPILCLGYILLPWKRMAFVKRPKIRFLVHAGSRLTLLCILIGSTSSRIVNALTTTNFQEKHITDGDVLAFYIVESAKPFTPLMIIILVWIIGMTVRAFKHIWDRGIAVYFRSKWNLMDFLQLIFYWIFIVAGFVSYIKADKIAEEHNLFEEENMPLISRGEEVNGSVSSSPTEGSTPTSYYGLHYGWGDFQAQLVSEAAFAIANVLSFLQILHHLIAFSLLGPLLISFGGMIWDVLKFFMIFGFLLVSFSIGLTQLYHKFEALEFRACELNVDHCKETPFLNFGQSMGSLFWSLFNMVDLDNLKVERDLIFTETVGSIIYAAFMLIGSIILLNALIAMMSNTYTRVEENTDVEWKVARTEIMAEYIEETTSMPPPFNLVPTVKSLIRLCKYLRRKSRGGGDPGLQQQHCKSQGDNRDDTYEEVSHSLGERCLRLIDVDRMRSRSGSDMKALKKSVEKFSCEMADIKQQLNNILSVFNQKTGDSTEENRANNTAS